MTLTEQWKKGELEDDWYYIKTETGDFYIFYIDDDSYMYDDTEEVLAPVPSYEEWRDLEDDLATCDKDLNNVCEQKEELYEENQQLKKENTQLRKFLEEFNALDVAKENQQLKELLKECRVYVENCEQFNAYDFEMLKTIDNAIGEK